MTETVSEPSNRTIYPENRKTKMNRHDDYLPFHSGRKHNGFHFSFTNIENNGAERIFRTTNEYYTFSILPRTHSFLPIAPNQTNLIPMIENVSKPSDRNIYPKNRKTEMNRHDDMCRTILADNIMHIIFHLLKFEIMAPREFWRTTN